MRGFKWNAPYTGTVAYFEWTPPHPDSPDWECVELPEVVANCFARREVKDVFLHSGCTLRNRPLHGVFVDASGQIVDKTYRITS